MRRVRAVLIVCTAGAIAAIVSLVALFAYYGRGLPDVHNLRAQWHPPQTTRVLARDGSVLAELFVERRTVVPMSDIPPDLVKAFLAAEDADFYRHHGLDYLGMVRALVVDIRRGTTAQGASTITQQVVKNVLLTPERTLARKVREVLLARAIEHELTKNEILHLYLNQIGLGHGRNGVEEASLYYFGKHVRELTLGECAILAGIPKNPSHYSPRADLGAAMHRRHWILGQMVANEFVSQADADAADREPVHLADTAEDNEGIAPEVVEAARTMLRATVGDEALRAGGYTVTTTIDPAMEREARLAVQAGLRELDARQGYEGPLLAPGVRRVRGRSGYVLAGEGLPADGRLLPGHVYGGIVDHATDGDAQHPDAGEIVVRVGDVTGRIGIAQLERYGRGTVSPVQFAPAGASVRVSVDRVATRDAVVPMRLELGPQGALVAIDPATREVRALVGGYEALAGMFDRATRSHRQAGSAFKPFLYSLALSSRRYTLATTVDPTPACFEQWCPHESHALAAGEIPTPMRLREALAQSRNMVAARVVIDLGPAALAEHATRIGLTSPLTPVPALALGTADVTPLEMTDAYTTWDASGRFAPPVLIARIVGPDGRDVPLPGRAAPRVAIAPEEAYLVTSMMTSVVDHGTGQRARALRRPVAGKTGTSNEARDAWFVGYTTDLVAGVWVGFDDRQPLGHGEEGARSAVPIWTRFMQSYIADRHPPALEFPRPPGVQIARIDPITGLLATPDRPDALEEYFLPGTVPAAPVVAPDAALVAGQPDAALPPPTESEELAVPEPALPTGTAPPAPPVTAADAATEFSKPDAVVP